MELFVNDEKIEITLETEKTVGDVLRSFEEDCAKNNATTVNIVLDGNLVSAEDFDEICKKEFSETTKLELTVITQDEIKNSFKVLGDECKDLSEKLLEVPVNIQSGKDREVNGLIAKLADFVDKFCHTASLSALFPEIFKNISIDSKNLTEFFADFSQILGDFEQAISSKDTVLMGDLAEYEISPRLLAISNAVKEI